MNAVSAHNPPKRCAVYCRVSSDERLDQEFNSIDAQKEAGHTFIASQRTEAWLPVTDDYDDPGFSGVTMERPALKRLLAHIEWGKIDIVVVYKIDRLSRSLADFARIVEIFDRHRVSFSAVTKPSVSHVLRLAFLAPEPVERVPETQQHPPDLAAHPVDNGREPSGMK